MSETNCNLCPRVKKFERKIVKLQTKNNKLNKTIADRQEIIDTLEQKDSTYTRAQGNLLTFFEQNPEVADLTIPQAIERGHVSEEGLSKTYSLIYDNKVDPSTVTLRQLTQDFYRFTTTGADQFIDEVKATVDDIQGLLGTNHDAITSLVESRQMLTEECPGPRKRRLLGGYVLKCQSNK